MPALEWSDALSLDLPLMDDTHREFVELLGAVEASADDAVIAVWRTLVEHTQVHFDQEDRWMRETRLEATQRQLDAVLHDDPRVHASPERPDVP